MEKSGKIIVAVLSVALVVVSDVALLKSLEVNRNAVTVARADSTYREYEMKSACLDADRQDYERRIATLMNANAELEKSNEAWKRELSIAQEKIVELRDSIDYEKGHNADAAMSGLLFGTLLGM